MSEDISSVPTNTTSASGNKLPSTTRKTIVVRSTRTPNTMFSAESKPSNPTSSVTTSTRSSEKPLNRVQTAPTRPAGHSSTAETTPPRRQRTTDLPLSISHSHSSDSRLDTHSSRPSLHFQTQNPRESVASTELSSYYSAEDSFNASIDEDVPPLPNPHPLSTSVTGSKQTTALTPSTSASEQTVIPTQDFTLAYRSSTRTTASSSTRATGRSASTSASVIEPSRQSTSDSEAYPRGNGLGPASNIKLAEGEEDLAVLVAGLDEFVEEPGYDDEEPKLDAKGKMKMPEPQYFSTRLPTTQEEDEDISDYLDNERDQTIRMPEPFTHSRGQSSSTAQTLAQTSTGTTARKVSPLIIPPTPKSPPPVPSSTKGEKETSTGGGGIASSTGLGKSNTSTEPNSYLDFNAPHAGASAGTAPLNVRRVKRLSSNTATGGEGASSATTNAEKQKDNALQQHYGTATITGMSSSRIDRPGSGGGGMAVPARTSVTSTSFSGTASGRVKTDSTSHHRPSIDAHTYTHGRNTSTASASGRPPESRMSSGGGGGGGGTTRLPPLPNQEKEKPSASNRASAALDAAGLAGRPRLPPGVSSQLDTQYVNMLLALDDIPTIYNLAAAFFNWIYLAGFVLFPGTFTSLKNLGTDQGNAIAAQVINTVTQLPLFIVAWVCVGIGGTGMLWLLWRWNKNYIWVLNKIWTPGLLNSLAGLLSTIASVYGAQHGQFSSTSKATLILTGLSSAIFLVLTLFYMFWLVRRVKQKHDREVGVQRAGKHGEGFVDSSARK